jgi:tetratricopeptide (TPR) repeat protein
VRLGDAAVARDMLDEAIAHFDRAIALEPRNARLYLKKAGVFNKLDPARAPEAIELTSKAIELDASNVEAYVERAWAKGRNKDDEGAFQDVAHAVEIGPRFPSALHLYGNGLRDRKRFDEAFAMYDRAHALEPRDPNVLFDRALARILSGDPAHALADLDESIEIHPAFFCYRARAIARARTGDHDGAIQDAERAVELAPTDSLSRKVLDELRGR